jgi:hypothetical protein
MNIESQRRYRTYLIVFAYLIGAMKGIRYGYFQYIPIELNYFYSIVLALFLTEICIVDSRIVGKPLSIFSYWLVFMLYGIAVPICIIWKRGKFGLVMVTTHLIGLILVHTIFWIVTSLLVYEGF